VVSRLSIKKIQAGELFLDRLPQNTKKAFLRCAKLPLFLSENLYLAGGTALALQAGHRQSVDLDFFSPNPKISEIGLERKLLATKEWDTAYREQGTIYGTFLGAKMSLIAYPFFAPSSARIQYGTIKILLADDIAAMKIIAISQRGRKRDFVDLYWYCLNREPLVDVLMKAVMRYPGQKHNMPHFLKSLTYFADAENDPAPKLFFKASWRGIKAFFRREVKKAAKELLGLK